MDTQKHNLKFISRDMLKFIALIAMVIGHFLIYTASELKAFGIPQPFLSWIMSAQFIAPPIFMFFITEGFQYTRSKSKYAVRLLIFALLTQIPFILCENMTLSFRLFFSQFNVIFGLLAGLISLIILESKLKLPLKVLIIAVFMAAGNLLNIQWGGVYGLLFILIFYIFSERPVIRIGVFTVIALIYSKLIPSLLIPMLLSVILITFFYNGEKGKYPNFSKYFMYIIYPIHYWIIYIVKYIA